MRHKQRNSRPEYPSHPAPASDKNDYSNHPYPSKDELPFQPAPGGAATRKPGLRERIREKIHEKPATHEEIKQLELDTRREQLRSQKYNFKHQRPSALERVMGGGKPQQPAPRYTVSRQPRQQVQPSYGSIWGSGSFGGNLLGGGENSLLRSRPYYQQPQPRKKNQPPQKSGLERMFSL